MITIDLKSHPFLCQFSGKTLEGGTYVHRTTDLLADNGLHAAADFPPVRSQIPRRFQYKKVFLPRPILMHGFCSTHLPRKSSRYRSVPSLSKQKTLPYGHSWQCSQIYSCRSQRNPRLAYLCGISSTSYCNSQKTLQHRHLSWRFVGNCLRSGFNNNRPLPICISLGLFSQNEKCYQASHTTGFKRQYSHVYPYFRRQTSRCQCSRYPALGGWSFLHYGSRISGFQTTFCFQQNSYIFCNSSKNQYQIQTIVFSAGGQIHRPDLRSNNCANRPQKQKRVSRETPARQVQGPQHIENSCFSNKQFRVTFVNHCETIQKSLAGRTVFQMDQAASQNQKILRHICERSKNSDMDCRLSLCARGDYEKEITPPRKPLHNSTDFKCDYIRKRFDLSANYRARHHGRRNPSQ